MGFKPTFTRLFPLKDHSLGQKITLLFSAHNLEQGLTAHEIVGCHPLINWLSLSNVGSNFFTLRYLKKSLQAKNNIRNEQIIKKAAQRKSLRKIGGGPEAKPLAREIQ